MPLGMEVGLSPGHFVLDGDPAPLSKKGRSPPFSAHVYCGKTAAWIKMSLGTEVGLGKDDIVLHEDPAPISKKGVEPPIFGPFLLWPNGWMHQEATRYGGRPQPRRLCVRWGPSPSPQRGAAPNFRPMSVVAKTAGWIKMPLGTDVGLGPDDIVLDGDPALPTQKKRYNPQFSTHVYCGETAVCIRIPLGTEVGISLGDIVLDGYPAPPRLKRHSPQFSANVRCAQTVGWTKMPLGMEVGLGPGDFVFDGDLAPQKKAQPHPIFAHVCCDQTAG